MPGKKFVVNGDSVEADVDAFARHALFFAEAQQVKRDVVEVFSFPGGEKQFREVCRYISSQHNFHFDFTPESLNDWWEAAAIVRCPRLLKDIAIHPYIKTLPSKTIREMLERILPYTNKDCEKIRNVIPEVTGVDNVFGASGPPPFNPPPRIGGTSSLEGESALPKSSEPGTFQEAMWQAFSLVIQRLCAMLDASDFWLSSSLAAGNTRASLEILKSYKAKFEKTHAVDLAFQHVTKTFKSFFEAEDGNKGKKNVSTWNEHQFALDIFRRNLIEAAVGKGGDSSHVEDKRTEETGDVGDESSEEGEADEEEAGPEKAQDDDITEEVYDVTDDETLKGLVDLIPHFDPVHTPPMLIAIMIRTLLLIARTDEARKLFRVSFARSRKVRRMIVSRDIPADFLGSVRDQKAASVVLRRLLARYQKLEPLDLCSIVEDVLLRDFKSEKFGHQIIFQNDLVRDIVCFTCRPGRAAEDEAESKRLQRTGAKLFTATFLTHKGFLPTQTTEAAEDRPGIESPIKKGKEFMSAAGAAGVAECPWDNSDLPIDMLEHVPMVDDALQMGRKVLLRFLKRNGRELCDNIPRLTRLWEYGRWPLCKDEQLIGEAFSFLTSCWRTLRQNSAGSGITRLEDGAAHMAAQEAVFHMFSRLEFWRLKPDLLLTPWVPGQILACHIAAQYKHLEQRQHELIAENRRNLGEINQLRSVVTELTSRLETADARSQQNMQKQSVIDEALRKLR